MNKELLARLFNGVYAAVDFERVSPWLTEGSEKAQAAVSAGLARTQTGISVIPVRGVLTLHPVETIFGSFGGRTTLMRRRFTEAMADDGVGAIVLDFDSPGGTVDGIPELAALMREARGKKPVIAVANTLIASAAYWLAAQADEIVATPSADLGSIGVFMHHISYVGYMSNEGMESTIIRSVEQKAAVNPYEILSDDARADLQARVNATHEMFVGDVAKGRGVTPATVRAEFGEGRVMNAKDAVAAGVADRVATLEQVISGLVKPSRAASNGRRLRGALAFS